MDIMTDIEKTVHSLNAFIIEQIWLCITTFHIIFPVKS